MSGLAKHMSVNAVDEIEEIQQVEVQLDQGKFPVEASHSLDTQSALRELVEIRQRLIKNKLYLELLATIYKDQSELDPAKSFNSFHLRKDEFRKFRTGDIVAVDGDLKLSDDTSRARSSTFLVICDESQKKLSRSIPFHSHGHWCIAVGIVKIRVDGAVSPGELIGSKGDGTGCGIVVTTSDDTPVLGFALSSSSPLSRSGSFSPSASPGNCASMATILISQDPTSVAEKSLLHGNPDRASAGESIAASDIRVLMTMLERYVSLVSAGNQASPIRDAFHRMRQQLLADHSGPGHARFMRHTLLLPGNPAGSGPAADEAELLSLRFGLPTHARVGIQGFQPRSVTVAEVGQSLDAATYLETLISQNRGSGLVCAVHGRAGCGKSALASAVVSRLQQCSSMAVVWLDASNLTTICRGMMALAKTLLGFGRRGGLDRKPNQQIGALQVVSAWLREERNWLLVLDDVRNVEELEELNIPLGNGMVLLTTRLPLDALKARFEGCTGVELGPFRPEEALEYVRRFTGAADRDAMPLCERVQHFPITLAHATAHLLQRKVPILQLVADLKRKLEQEAKSTKGQAQPQDPEYPPCFLSLLELRVSELRTQQSSAALRLLFMLSFLNSRGIRYKMISTELIPRARESIAALFQQRLIGEDQEGLINVHQLVQDAVRHVLADWSDSVDIQASCCMTSACYPGAPSNVSLITASDILAQACRLVVEEMTSRDRDAIELAAPHALKLIGHNGQDLELLRITAEFLSEIQKDFTKSLEMRHCMLKVLTASGEAADPVAVSATYAGIANIHEQLGQHNDAISAHEEVVRVLKKHRREPLRIAKTLDSIGMIFYKTQRFKGALLRFEESLSIKESLPEAGAAPEIVITLERIADSYCAQGYYEIALEKWHRVLEILRGMPEASKDIHREIARALNTMGLIHADLQRYDEALRFYKESLATLKQSQGDVGVYEARIHCSIAKCHQSLGRYDDAVANYQTALALQRKLCIGVDELSISQTLDEIAYAFSVCGNYASAVANLRESIAIKLKLLEPNDLKLARAKVDLALQLKHLGINNCSGNANILEALDLIASAQATYEHVLGSADALTAHTAAVHSELLAASKAAADLSQALSPRSLTINMTPRSARKSQASPRTPMISASPRTLSNPTMQGNPSSPQASLKNFSLQSVPVDRQKQTPDPHADKIQQLPPLPPQQKQDVF